ncbi:MAG: DUF1080 domain-containing protein [Acidobacteriota bacterium]|nr:MAG: DUF1080 domain-containing protein [Acidobacteriota bacterium]
MGVRTLLLIPLLALLLSGLALTEAQPRQEGWVSLFEGVSLRGWSGQEESDWNVSEGHLTATTGQLLNRWCWVDFELSFSFRGKGTLLFRVGSDQMGHIGFGQTGYRMELPPQTIPEPGQAGSSREPDPASSRSWQTARLIVTGDHFRLLINDQPAIEMTDDRSPLKGRIGLAASGEPFSIEFVRIRPLNVEQAENIPADNFYCYVCHSNFE